jgi:hypothetical protein
VRGNRPAHHFADKRHYVNLATAYCNGVLQTGTPLTMPVTLKGEPVRGQSFPDEMR